MQPNTYYEVTQIKPPKPPKKPSRLPLVLAIIFAITTIGLIVVLVLEKLAPKQPAIGPDETETHVLSAPLFTRLSEIDIPDDSPEDIIKNALAGRTFLFENNYDQYLRFITDSKFEFAYYANPDTDFRKLQASDDNGTYKITNNKTITLSNGESFTITGDYLVKTTDTLSHNQNYVYFHHYFLKP